MGLTVNNLTDGTSQSISSGDTVDVVLQGSPGTGATDTNSGPRALFIESDVAIDQIYTPMAGPPIIITPLVSADVVGDLTPNCTALTIFNGSHTSPQFVAASRVVFTTPFAPGTYYVSFSLTDNNGVQFCTIRIRVLPAFNLQIVKPISYITGLLADLQYEMSTRVVNSSLLSHCAGLVRGDDFTFAVVPMLHGSVVTSGITAISLELSTGPGSDDASIIFPAASVTPIGSGSNIYYAIAGNLRAAEIGSWFQDANDKADKAGTPRPDRLDTYGQLKITNAAGITYSQLFPLPIQQSL